MTDLQEMELISFLVSRACWINS